MSTYYSLVTLAGFAAEANAKGLGQLVNLSEFAIGDSGGNEYDPTGEEAALVNELYRGAINDIIFDPEQPNQFIVEGVVPQNVGGFTVREAAVFTDTGILYGIAKYPPSYKTTIESGASSELKVRIVFATANTSTMNLVIDPSAVLSTREYVDSKVSEERSYTDNSFKSIEVNISKSADISKNKLHIFTAFADLQIPEATGDSFRLVIKKGLALTDANKCRLLAPTGKKIYFNDAAHDICNIKDVGIIHTVYKDYNGDWHI